MARGFWRGRRGIRARLNAQERALLAHLFVEVYELLDDQAGVDPDPLAAMVGIGTAVDPPSDPALARLLPDAHREDTQASADFRRYTEVGLRERKRAGLEVARRTLGREGAFVLDDTEARAWVVALTDVRLVLAERIGLRTDEDHDRLLALIAAGGDSSSGHGEDDAQGDRQVEGLQMLLRLYDFLTWLQETLVEALVAPMADG